MSVQNDVALQIMSEREAYVRSRLQSALSRLSFMSLNNTNFGGSLHYVGKIINEAVKGDFSTIHAYKPEKRQLEIYDVIGLHDYKSQSFQMLLSIDDNHFLAQSVHSDTPIIAQQITQDIGVAWHEPQIDFVREYNVSASISCRIKQGDRLFGAIAVHRMQDKELLQMDAEFLLTFINFF
jgi:transcriptional regulator with GAF, ATPase, and Fis domain